MINNKPILVGHRGYPQRYPENTLTGIEAAIKAGAKAIEFDIQLSADAVPVLFHDETLERVTGHSGRIMDQPFSALRELRAAETERFQSRFENVPISSLAEASETLMNHRDTEIFVEIKHESLTAHGTENTVKAVIDAIQPVAENCIITSFDADALSCARKLGFKKTAWVLKAYTDEVNTDAKTLSPDFLVCDIQKIPTTVKKLWQGDWQWMVYTADDIQTAMEYYHKGANYVETDDIGVLLKVQEKQ